MLRGEDVAAIDADAQRLYGIPALVMMEQAGLKAWQAIRQDLDAEQPIVVACGGGNNGGDGLVIAREAVNDGFVHVTVILVGHRLSDCNRIHRSIIKAYGIPAYEEESRLETAATQALSAASVIIDAVTGTGLKKEIGGLASELVKAMNDNLKATVYAIDCPSGMGDEVSASSLHVHAHCTLCMGPLKSMFYHPALRAHCGKIIEINPSFPPGLVAKSKLSGYLADDEVASLDPLPSDAYKKDRGHLAIFGGCSRYTGALRLAGRSAFASRAGLVSAICDRDIYPIIAGESPSVIVRMLDETDTVEPYTAVLAGPGWGGGREELLTKLLRCSKPLVIDADGIRAFANLYAEGKVASHQGTVILTPHLGELHCLCKAVMPDRAAGLGKEDSPASFLETLSALSEKIDAIIVAKGGVTYVAVPGKLPVAVSGGNPSLGVAGSGDVLAGCMAGLLAGGLSPFKSALSAVLWHQEAGRYAFAKEGYYSSEDLIPFLAKVIAT